MLTLSFLDCVSGTFLSEYKELPGGQALSPDVFDEALSTARAVLNSLFSTIQGLKSKAKASREAESFLGGFGGSSSSASSARPPTQGFGPGIGGLFGGKRL